MINLRENQIIGTSPRLLLIQRSKPTPRYSLQSSSCFDGASSTLVIRLSTRLCLLPALVQSENSMAISCSEPFLNNAMWPMAVFRLTLVTPGLSPWRNRNSCPRITRQSNGCYNVHGYQTWMSSRGCFLYARPFGCVSRMVAAKTRTRQSMWIVSLNFRVATLRNGERATRHWSKIELLVKHSSEG